MIALRFDWLVGTWRGSLTIIYCNPARALHEERGPKMPGTGKHFCFQENGGGNNYQEGSRKKDQYIYSGGEVFS